MPTPDDDTVRFEIHITAKREDAEAVMALIAELDDDPRVRMSGVSGPWRRRLPMTLDPLEKRMRDMLDRNPPPLDRDGYQARMDAALAAARQVVERYGEGSPEALAEYDKIALLLDESLFELVRAAEEYRLNTEAQIKAHPEHAANIQAERLLMAEQLGGIVAGDLGDRLERGIRGMHD